MSDPAGRDGNLEGMARAFGEELVELLEGTLPNVPAIVVTTHGNAYQIQPDAKDGAIPLSVSGRQLASLIVKIRCRLDSRDEYLAVESSRYALKAGLDRTPVLRFDFERDMYKVPCAHVQVHAHRGALSHLLSRANHHAPHDMSSLHIPVGGSRFRPCLEDVLQFLIEECRFDHREGWKQHVEEGRARWRRRQLAAAVRDLPGEAAQALQDMGYIVTPPEQAPSPASGKLLNRW